MTKGSERMAYFSEPTHSPWGEVQWCDILCTGVYLVGTDSHGGTMVSQDIKEFLSPAARKCGQRKNGYLCFEEDCDENIVLRELLDKKMWDIPDRIKDRAAFEEAIDNNIRKYHPDYWRSRGRGRERADPPPPEQEHDDR